MDYEAQRDKFQSTLHGMNGFEFTKTDKSGSAWDVYRLFLDDNVKKSEVMKDLSEYMESLDVLYELTYSESTHKVLIDVWWSSSQVEYLNDIGAVIDTHIAPIVQLFNDNGYPTHICCSGVHTAHTEKFGSTVTEEPQRNNIVYKFRPYVKFDSSAFLTGECISEGLQNSFHELQEGLQSIDIEFDDESVLYNPWVLEYVSEGGLYTKVSGTGVILHIPHSKMFVIESKTDSINEFDEILKGLLEACTIVLDDFFTGGSTETAYIVTSEGVRLEKE